MRIVIDTIPHCDQRYNTIGDWQWLDNDTLHIKVSNMNDVRYECLVGIHELVETILCKANGITEDQVDAFDLSHPELHEPGDSPSAPYFFQHKIACDIEELLMPLLKVNAVDYERTMEKLQQERDYADSKAASVKES